MPEFYFRANAKVENLVGRDLITSNTIAIFELVKNAYDAGAYEVEIVFENFLSENDAPNKVISTNASVIHIIDNGKGMTCQEIQDYWMELGTPHKEKEKVEEVRLRNQQVNTVVRRIVNGEKGIGRFGVDKIGSKLRMMAIDKRLTEKTAVEFDWALFDDRDKLFEQIPCQYETYKVESGDKQGVMLSIMDLRDKWTVRDLSELKKSLKKFLSPIRFEDDEFRVFFTHKESGKLTEKREEIVNDTFENLSLSLSADLSTNGRLKFNIIDKDEQVQSGEYIEQFKHPFGAAKVKLYYLDKKDKINFTKAMGLRTSDYGNVKIFKDNFRIMPYGEPDNDWLEIDKRHAQGIFRTIGTRDLIGYIFLSHDPAKKNLVLREATDRVGLIEDVPEFDEFKKFVWTLIGIFEGYIFNRIKKKAKETTEVLKYEASGLRKDTTNLVISMKNILGELDLPKEQKNQLYRQLDYNSKELVKKIDNVERASKEVEQRIKILSQITNKEGILYEMLHGIRNKLAVIDAAINRFDLKIRKNNFPIDTNELRTAVNAISKLVSGSLNKVSSSKLRKKVMPINEVITDFIQDSNALLEDEQIKIIDRTQLDDTLVKCSLESVKSVLENLLNNSMKALKGHDKKRVYLESEVAGSWIYIYFSDNGIGIPENRVPLIFSLWSSDTNGSGIGLTSARDIIEDHGGELHYVDLGNPEISTTFMIKLPVMQK